MKKIDYTTVRSDGNFPKDGADFNKRWWLSNKTDRAKDVFSVVQELVNYDAIRQDQYSLSAKLYGNTQFINLSGLTVQRQISQPRPAVKERLTYNVVQSAIDTVTAKTAKNKPKPLFLTSGGDWKLQRKAKKLDKFVEGVFYENDAYRMGVLTFRDAGVLGDGLVQVFEHYGRVKFERVMATELYVDWFEAYYNNPRQLHRVKNVDRAVLIDLFPEKKAAILRANTAARGAQAGGGNISDQVTVTESWHLPSGPEATDGIHHIGLEDETLFEEDWKKPFFPFARMPWSPRLNGFWSQGAAEQIQNIQYEINKILYLIQRALQLSGSFKVLVKRGSKIVKEHLNNEIGAIVEYTDTPPQYVTPPSVPIEFYQQLQNLKTAAFEQLGVSQLSASSQKPAGLDSGKALREYSNIESDRFMTIGQAYEQFYLELARLTVDCAKDIYARDGKYQVKVPGKKFIQTIDWKDIDMEEDEYFLKIFPTSTLPNDPAGRLQSIQEYVQAGMISVRTGKRLLDFPDLEQESDLQSAEEDYLHMVLEKIVDDGVLTPLEAAFDDLQLALEMGLEYYAQGKLNNLEEERLDLLRDFINQVKLGMGVAAAPQPGAPADAGPGGTGGAPQAAPEPAPTSNMIPNVPGMQS